MLSPEPATADELDAVIDLIVREQARRNRHVPSLGTRRDQIRAELDELEPAWSGTLRVVRGPTRRVVGAVVVDWNPAAGRAWFHGPWVDVDDDRWLPPARRLVEVASAQLPPGVTGRSLSGDVAHHLMAALAAELGWSSGEVNHVLVAPAVTVAGWSRRAGDARVRRATTEDLEPIRRMHDREFPGTYFSASQLLERAAAGRQVVLVAERAPGEVCGYAAGRVQPDGDGYVDFLAVDAPVRRSGAGRALMSALGDRLLRASTTHRICLTVQDDRAAARALYESLGFQLDISIVGYGSGAAS